MDRILGNVGTKLLLDDLRLRQRDVRAISLLCDVAHIRKRGDARDGDRKSVV